MLSCLILIILVIYPQVASLISNQKTKGEIINRSKFLEVKAQQLESFDTAQLNQQLESALAAYPNSKDFVNVFGLVQNLTIKSGFTLTSISLGALQKNTANTQSYAIKIEVLGSLNLLPILLNNLESSPRLMRVVGINTAPVSLELDVLYSSAPLEFGSTDSSLPQLSEQDEQVIAKLAREGSVTSTSVTTPVGLLGPRGKANPFE